MIHVDFFRTLPAREQEAVLKLATVAVPVLMGTDIGLALAGIALDKDKLSELYDRIVMHLNATSGFRRLP